MRSRVFVRERGRSQSGRENRRAVVTVLAIFLFIIGTLLVLIGALLILIGTFLISLGAILIFTGLALIAVGVFLLIRRHFGRDREP
ncbi:hypothetical protein [Streptomyces sp. IBSBF 3136]|uniref:hypothetical protein n=1 Tax=Streptomyces sp. IBSBF 3136 TaxID=2903524 RepID=UPI002FDB9F16